MAEDLLRALAEYFEMPRESFASMMDVGNSILRILHYPPVKPEHAPAVRASAHEDINLITLLCEATDSGLEILTREGEWMPVETGPGQIVVDAGDMLSRFTNEVIPATTHRVVNPAERRDARPLLDALLRPPLLGLRPDDPRPLRHRRTARRSTRRSPAASSWSSGCARSG